MTSCSLESLLFKPNEHDTDLEFEAAAQQADQQPSDATAAGNRMPLAHEGQKPIAERSVGSPHGDVTEDTRTSSTETKKNEADATVTIEQFGIDSPETGRCLLVHDNNINSPKRKKVA